MEEVSYIVETSKSVSEAAVALRKAVEGAKWGILGGYDFSEILESKGFPQSESIRALDICAPRHANRLIAADRLAALCMPCNVLIYSEKGRTKLAALRPGIVMPRVFGELDAETADYVRGIDSELKSILDEAT